VIVKGTGDFGALPGVERVDRRGAVHELWLSSGTAPQAILRELVRRPDVEVERFEVAAPSLDDIFIAVVEGRERVERRAPAVAEAVEA
jgi:ABC-type uncharacterized transport system ATPase subunit